MKLKAWILQHRVLASLVGIVVLAIILRFYQLGTVPHGLTWDEAAVGYNGFAIWTIYRDEWLQLLPVSFKSFGDFKAPLLIYATGIFTWLIGLEPWVIRLVPTISGVLCVLGIAWLTWEVLRYLADEASSSKSRHQWWTLVVALLLAVTPWHLHLSRIGMESGVSLLLVLLGTAAWFHGLRLLKGVSFSIRLAWLKPFTHLWNQPWLWQMLSLGWLSLSLYTYHSAKLMVPLLGLSLLLLGWRQVWPHKKLLVIGAVTLVILLAPLLYDSIYGDGSQRLAQAVIKTDGQTPVQVVAQLSANFAAHFSLDYLTQGQTTTLRHGDGRWGVLLWPTLGLALLGILRFFQRKATSDNLPTKLALWAVWWLVIGVIPAAIGQEVPHSNRALLALPGWLWLAVLGLDWLSEFGSQARWDLRFRGTHGESQLLVKCLIGLVILSHALFFAAYLHHYYTKFARDSAADFQDGYLEAMSYILPYEKGDAQHQPVDKIMIDNGYGQPYIYLLMARRTNPIWYHGGVLIKYEFPDQVDEGYLLRPNTLIMATGLRDMPWDQADQLIYGSDGQIRFGIFVNQ